MNGTRLTAIRLLAAAAVLASGLDAAVCTAASPSQPHTPTLHTVPTNVPGVYAFAQPPTGFDARKATDQELQAWGYPGRPGPLESTDAWERWQAQVSPSLKREVPYLARHEGVFHRPASGVRSQALPSRYNAIAAASSNWSGVALYANSGAQPYAMVQAAWIVPAVKQPPGTCSGDWDYSSQWIGMGGFGDSYLLQAGSEADAFCNTVPGADTAFFVPWIEWLPAAETEIRKSGGALFPFAAGDYVVVTITATHWTGGVSTSGTLAFSDVTQGWTFSLTFTAASLGGSQVAGRSAEWVVERPEVNGSLATLPDYVAVPWLYAKTQDLGLAYHFPGSPGNAAAYDITMLDDGNAAISFVDLIGANALWFFAEGSATK